MLEGTLALLPVLRAFRLLRERTEATPGRLADFARGKVLDSAFEAGLNLVRYGSGSQVLAPDTAGDTEMIKTHALPLVLFASVGVLALGCVPNKDSSPASPAPSASRPAGTMTEPQPPVVVQPLVTVLPRAATVLTQIIKEQGMTGERYLRIRVLPGGCTGLMKKLDLDSEVSPAVDHVFESGGIKVVVWKRQIEMLRGTQIDHAEEGEVKGFVIKNPNLDGEALKKWLPVLAAEKRPE